MIDVFVFLPFAGEKEKDGKTDIDLGSQNDQDIDLRVCVCVHIHRWACVVFISAGWCQENYCLYKQMASIGWLIIGTGY